MLITVDNIAKTLMAWCNEKSPELKRLLKDHPNTEIAVKEQLLSYLKKSTCCKFLNEASVYKTSDSAAFVFNPEAENPAEKILAELNIENSDGTSFENEVINNIVKLSTIDNIIDDYKQATKCIISLYVNRYNKLKLHEKQFIEIFNNAEIACAMKKLNH